MQNKVKQTVAAIIRLKMLSTMKTPKLMPIQARMVLPRIERLMLM
jgi:hypothetical protein